MFKFLKDIRVPDFAQRLNISRKKRKRGGLVIPPLCLLPEEEVLATVSFKRGLLEVAATNKRVIKFQKGDGIWILDLPYHKIVSIGIGAKVKLGDLKLILIGILLLFLGMLAGSSGITPLGGIIFFLGLIILIWGLFRRKNEFKLVFLGKDIPEPLEWKIGFKITKEDLKQLMEFMKTVRAQIEKIQQSSPAH
jgi:hypothetical protein